MIDEIMWIKLEVEVRVKEVMVKNKIYDKCFDDMSVRIQL